jgi:dihydrofolate synthase / folylpolyglutamate synthase
MTYQETLDYLYAQLPMFQRIGAAAYKPNLDNTIALCKALGNPEKKIPCIHIAGTNGKGSTSHLLASIFQEAGYKVGLYTSPHLIDFRERIKINGKPISKKYVIDFTKKSKALFEQIKPSFFEMTVGICFDYFKSKRVDIAIIETGLGGRLDSTNVIRPLLSVITNISFDHMHLLGDTIEKIAFEKAGIIKPHTPVVIGEREAKSAKVFIKRAKEEKAEIHFASDNYKLEALKLSYNKKNPFRKYEVIHGKKRYMIDSELSGNYQTKNLATVIKSLDVFKTSETSFSISNKNIYNGIRYVIKNTGLLGRWQIIHNKPLVICDTGHNEAGIRNITEQIKQCSYKNLHIVIGMVNDKDVSKVLSLLPKNAEYYFTKANIPRALDAKELQVIAQNYKLKGSIYKDVKSAYKAAKSKASRQDMIFIGGSTFVVADLLTYLK